MEPENQPSRHELKQSTDPQQSEMDLNVFGSTFQDAVGDTKGRQDEADQPSASQTAGVDDGQADQPLKTDATKAQDRNEKID